MIDHLKLPVTDTTRSRAFYERALAPVGYRVMHGSEPGEIGMGADWPHFWFAPVRGAPTPAHVAFRVDTREAVDAFHAAALEAGGRDNGGPGLRPQYHASYYAAFVLDPDGHNVEAVCHAGGD